MGPDLAYCMSGWGQVEHETRGTCEKVVHSSPALPRGAGPWHECNVTYYSLPRITIAMLHTCCLLPKYTCTCISNASVPVAYNAIIMLLVSVPKVGMLFVMTGVVRQCLHTKNGAK